MGHLEGNFTPVLYMGRKVPKGKILKLKKRKILIDSLIGSELAKLYN